MCEINFQTITFILYISNTTKYYAKNQNSVDTQDF